MNATTPSFYSRCPLVEIPTSFQESEIPDLGTLLGDPCSNEGKVVCPTRVLTTGPKLTKLKSRTSENVDQQQLRQYVAPEAEATCLDEGNLSNIIKILD